MDPVVDKFGRTPGVGYVCPECGSVFETHSGLLKHNVYHHPHKPKWPVITGKYIISEEP